MAIWIKYRKQFEYLQISKIKHFEQTLRLKQNRLIQSWFAFLRKTMGAGFTACLPDIAI
jgi:hypothetical protein